MFCEFSFESYFTFLYMLPPSVDVWYPCPFFSECISLLLLVYLAMKSVTRLLTSHGEELTHRASSQPILKYFHLLQWQ